MLKVPSVGQRQIGTQDRKGKFVPILAEILDPTAQNEFYGPVTSLKFVVL